MDGQKVDTVQLEINELVEQMELDSASSSSKDTIPHIIKYMGSKKPIIDFIVNSIDEIHSEENWICDLFAGSCSVSATLKRKYNFLSNDIQEYSKILAHTYFSDLSMYSFEEINDLVGRTAEIHSLFFRENFGQYITDYGKVDDISKYQRIENEQRELINSKEFGFEYHLFTKYYSGTYWSFEQCVWIDSLRKSAEQFRGTPIYYAVLSSIMYAMSYAAQSTGHFAQYRDGSTLEAMQDILSYRQKNVLVLFGKKLKELMNNLRNSLKSLQTSTLSFEKCLILVPEGSTVYADPPYAPVHYSRFYHALETLVQYDYPEVEHKGRYRKDRHQSSFSQKTKALGAFQKLFSGIIERKCQMLLSYSGSGVLSIDNIINLAKSSFSVESYEILIKTFDHKHSTMGRFEDRNREVIEYLIIAKKR